MLSNAEISVFCSDTSFLNCQGHAGYKVGTKSEIKLELNFSSSVNSLISQRQSGIKASVERGTIIRTI